MYVRADEREREKETVNLSCGNKYICNRVKNLKSSLANVVKKIGLILIDMRAREKTV